MRTLVPVPLLLCLVALSTVAADKRPSGSPASAREILDQVDDLFRGKSSRGKMQMRVVTSQWSRELTLEQWSKGKNQSLVRILAPQKEAGNATLRSGDNIWNYLPKVNRVIKVPTSMMAGSWMGSHFTNDDLVKQSRMADEFSAEKTFEGERDGKGVIVLTLTPKPDAAVVWGRVEVTVRPGDFIPTSIVYFDEDLKPARTMRFFNPRTFGKRTVPEGFEIIPADKPNEKTEMRYLELAYDVAIEDSFFSLRTLQK